MRKEPSFEELMLADANSSVDLAGLVDSLQMEYLQQTCSSMEVLSESNGCLAAGLALRLCVRGRPEACDPWRPGCSKSQPGHRRGMAVPRAPPRAFGPREVWVGVYGHARVGRPAGGCAGGPTSRLRASGGRAAGMATPAVDGHRPAALAVLPALCGACAFEERSGLP